MRLWRISNYADLKGVGGQKTPGRWHNKGIPVVYLSESPALAMLEVLVHFELDPSEVPDSYQLLEVEYKGSKGINALPEIDLPEEWHREEGYTRLIGDEWLALMEGVLLKVPSAIVSHSYNYLLNPRHELAREFKIIQCNKHPFDQRLI